jgi:membrane protein DedA with SNARE-associated domain
MLAETNIPARPRPAAERRGGAPPQIVTWRRAVGATLRAWWRYGRYGAVAVAVLLPLLVLALAEGDIPDVLDDIAGRMTALLPRFGLLAPFGLLFLEEAGIPLVLPGDVLLMYLGHSLPDTAVAWGLTWFALLVCVVAGSSVLYLIARRWGRPLAKGRVGAVLHLTPARLERAERWFQRWGPWTIIFGRHVIGCRVPVTVVAGICGVRYPVFALSVAVSAAPWIALFLFLGSAFGDTVQRLFGQHHTTSLIALPAVLGVAAVVVIFRTVRARRRHATP